ncbi:MAG: hypothetical protein GY870_02375 [archaeon]|nr:hypothetical protein [archaeon]
MAKRGIIGFFFGLIMATLGVFIFSGGSYTGRTIINVLDNRLIIALYEFVWISFRFNIFNLATMELGSAIFFAEFYPPAMSWFFASLISGTIVKGIKRGVLLSWVIVLSTVIIWLILAVLGGANISGIFFINISDTIGGILTALIAASLGGLMGGLINRRND